MANDRTTYKQRNPWMTLHNGEVFHEPVSGASMTWPTLGALEDWLENEAPPGEFTPFQPADIYVVEPPRKRIVTRKQFPQQADLGIEPDPEPLVVDNATPSVTPQMQTSEF